MIFDQRNSSNGFSGNDKKFENNFSCSNEEIISNYKQYNDSLAQYVKKGLISEDQVLLVRNLLKKKDPELAKRLKWQTISYLIKDSNLGVRRIISYALRFYSDYEKASLLLISSLKREKDWIVKEEMINSLSEIGLKFEKGNQIREEIELFITHFLSDKRHVIRIASIKAVLKLKIIEAKTQLESISILDPVLSVREKALNVLEDLIDKR
ncbi:MAG: HEAT repeat domain-containing protein [Candidatus Micrarchaeia archaeon]